jgi:hypothetical protein
MDSFFKESYMKIINIILLSLIIFFASCILGQSDGQAPSATSSSASYKKIFVSATSQAGNFCGAALADAFCAVDANLPSGGGTYKALLGETARMPPSTDWPLAASTTYVRSDGSTIIGTTTSGAIFTFPLTNAISSSGTSVWVWTGFERDSWTLNASNTCTDWTSNSGLALSYMANAIETNFGAITRGTADYCDQLHKFYCVEQ